MITSIKKRIRRIYSPLDISVSIKCDTPFSPLVQVFNADTNEYEPNRLATPCIIRPIIEASGSDGSWERGTVNNLLSLDRLHWYINGERIDLLNQWQGLYSIDKSNSADRGSISISRNIAPGETFSLHFEGDFADTRLGNTISIKTDPIVLSCIDKSEDNYSISVSIDRNIRYSAFDDKLLEYDYKVAHGIIEASAEEEQLARNGNQYERTIPIRLHKADKAITSGYTVKLFKKNNFNLTEITTSNLEVISISPTAIVLDMRVIKKANYVIKAYIDNIEKASVDFCVNRFHRSFTCTPTNETGIIKGQIERRDKARVLCNGKILKHPSYAVKISWFTDTASKQAVRHNDGQEVHIDMSTTGVGSTYSDDWVDVYTTAEEKGVFNVATDGNDTFVDSDNNTYIFN